MAETWIALLHSVVLGPGRRVEMGRLRAMAEEVGLAEARTLVATGNLLFEGRGPAETLEAQLEAAFEACFGRHVPILVRSGPAWRRMVMGNPFAESAEAAPATVHVRVMRTPISREAVSRLAAARSGEERLEVVDGDLWLHLPVGFSAARVAAVAGGAKMGVGTFRNWNTVRRLGAMLDR